MLPQMNSVPLLPLRELIVFPHEVYPIFVGRQKSIKALEAAEAQKKPILLAAQKDARVSEPGPDDIYAVGTLGVVVQLAAPARRHRQGAARGQEARARPALRQPRTNSSRSKSRKSRKSASARPKSKR